MCLRFDACFGVVHDHDDDCSPPPAKAKGVPSHHATTTTTTKTPHYPPPAQRNGYHGQQGFHHGNVYAAGAPEKAYTHYGAAADEAVKRPARNTKAADGAGHGAQNYYHRYEREPAHKEDTADYHYPAATAATADHERY